MRHQTWVFLPYHKIVSHKNLYLGLAGNLVVMCMLFVQFCEISGLEWMPMVSAPLQLASSIGLLLGIQEVEDEQL
jgi:hypothetical protein